MPADRMLQFHPEAEGILLMHCSLFVVQALEHTRIA